METQLIILIVAGVIAAGFTVFIASMLRITNDDDSDRWLRLVKEMNDRYPSAGYKARLEFLRREKYQAIKNTANSNDDFRELLKDYDMILDEQERINEGERQLGSEFDPFVSASKL